jgi:hypothetical protein
MTQALHLWAEHRTSRDLRMLAKIAREKYAVYVNGQLCPVETIERLVASSKGRYMIELSTYDILGNYALVTYDHKTPLKSIKISVDREVWQEAKLGEPFARYIITHELAHMLIHDGQQLHYSDTSKGCKGYPPDERSAEWQANVFTHFFLVSEKAAADNRPLLDVAHSIGVQRHVLETVRKYDASRDIFRFVNKIDFIGDSCGECGNFTLVRNGTCLKCDTCGGTTGCS